MSKKKPKLSLDGKYQKTSIKHIPTLRRVVENVGRGDIRTKSIIYREMRLGREKIDLRIKPSQKTRNNINKRISLLRRTLNTIPTLEYVSKAKESRYIKSGKGIRASGGIFSYVKKERFGMIEYYLALGIFSEDDNKNVKILYNFIKKIVDKHKNILYIKDSITNRSELTANKSISDITQIIFSIFEELRIRYSPKHYKSEGYFTLYVKK